MRKLMPLVLLALILPASAALAQSAELDPDAPPTFGSVTLSPDEALDPFVASMTISGSIAVNEDNAGVGCTGYAASAPDFRFTWTGEASHLSLFFSSRGDTTLMIRQPDGSYVCDDDGGIGLNGQIDITEPVEGDYTVWVGSFEAGDVISGYLMISRSALDPASIALAVAGGGLGDVADVSDLTFDAAALYGSAELTTGFMPDPQTVEIATGGDIDTFGMGLGVGCIGSVTAAPSYSLNWTGSSNNLRVFVVSDGDSTLIMRAPDGNFLCSDDFLAGGLDPLIDIERPMRGEYDIWVGTYTGYADESATLYITELTTLDPTNMRQTE